MGSTQPIAWVAKAPGVLVTSDMAFWVLARRLRAVQVPGELVTGRLGAEAGSVTIHMHRRFPSTHSCACLSLSPRKEKQRCSSSGGRWTSGEGAAVQAAGSAVGCSILEGARAPAGGQS